MKRAVLLTLVAIGALAGCAPRNAAEAPPAVANDAAPAPSNDQPADTPPSAGDGCDAVPAQRFVGEAYTAELGEEARLAAGATVVRALRPGEIVTMEYRGDRLTLTLDESGKISAVNCG